MYDAHDPISIDGDEGFKEYSFPGTGTKDDPYRIEGLNITTNQRNAVYIANTTVHFVISDCYLRTQIPEKDIGYRGIYLYHILSGTAHITNNTITGNWFGICVATDPKDLNGLDDITATISIVNNTIAGNIAGVDCRQFGYAVIANNTFTDNSSDSIYLSYFTNATIYNNMITGTSIGIQAFEGHTITTSNNTILIHHFGIGVDECNFVDIINNIIFDGVYGISWGNYDYRNRTIITNNTVIGS